MKLYVEKLYRYDQIMEPMSVCIPVARGHIFDASSVQVYDEDILLPSQSKVTSRYDDGSVRFLFTRFQGDIPGNQSHEYEVFVDGRKETVAKESAMKASVAKEPATKASAAKDSGEQPVAGGVASYAVEGFTPVGVTCDTNSILVDTGVLRFSVSNYSDNIFDSLSYAGKTYKKENFVGPVLKDGLGTQYGINIDKWRVVEAGDVAVVLQAEGHNELAGGGCEECAHYKFELRITAYAGKSYVDISYRLFNTSEKTLNLASLVFAIKEDENYDYASLMDMNAVLSGGEHKLDSTGCGDIKVDLSREAGPVYKTRGITDLQAIENATPVENVRTSAGASNYRTDFYIGRDGHEVNRIACAQDLLMEGNEHMSEVLYGTFFADRTDDKMGVTATVFQAHQNFPKAVKAEHGGLSVMLVPEGIGQVVMQPGMAREQRFELHFHNANESLVEIDNRSLIYQMPNRPVIAPADFAATGAMDTQYAGKINGNVEMTLIGKADAHSRSFGMLNWGDSIDQNYTKQGRGGGDPVWVNNEYDYPHACALMYARTGIRRYLDFCLVHASHWMDVDICHYSEDELRLGGMIEHTKGHVIDGVMVPSHEWVEGLIDYYHFTGDERGLEAAIGVGENVLRLLDTPAYQKTGESNARETGWALRTLTALYVETNDPKWKEKCGWIVGHFLQWRQEYGCFVAPYTDNTLVRVGFMISVAVGSLMRYYRIEPTAELKELIMAAVDDVLDNCRMECGLFYYKELPSLSRLGNNLLLLETMATGYELTGDTKYLEAGIPTLRRAVSEPPKYVGGDKKIIGDAMVWAGDSTKNFAQSFYPIAYYYRCLVKAGMDDRI